MGAADVVPGVSGGTMAFILGLYQRLLAAISAFDAVTLKLLLSAKLRKAWVRVDAVFLITLGFGIAGAVVFFTRVVPLPKLIETHSELIYGLFFGLIVGSAAVLIRSLESLRTGDYLGLCAGAIIGFVIVNLVPVQTPTSAWFVALSGALAISAMLLPGISGSFILLILQKYAYVFEGLGRLDFTIILPFALGCVAGLLAFSRFLSWLLTRWYRATLVTITGLLIGTLWRIWPFQERLYVTVRGKQRLLESQPVWPAVIDGTLLASAGLAVAGLTAVLIIGALARHQAR